MAYDINIREEELKNNVAEDYFWLYNHKKIIGDVDFCISIHQHAQELSEQESLLWAEAKKGISDVHKSLVQLILTIGKARTFDKYLPPAMLGAFDAEKIAFIPYNDIHDVFYLNDFNWNVAPSNYETKEFKIVYNKVKTILDQNTLLYFFGKDDSELKKFIKTNFIAGKFGFTKTRIDKNNFIVIYNKWLQTVKPTIAVNWDIAKKKGVIDGDFYLADLLSSENITLKDKLFVVLKATRYELNRHHDEYEAFTSSSVEFNDSQKAHVQFWNKYERPPLEQYWDYIIERRDLLVPQDVRERKGSFFTPQIWVELSQKYLTDVLGDNWQDEYYVWDCAAGTGNLLTGLTNKYNIWASTLDKQDVEVMKDRIKNGANLLEDHVFQFDFLNDDFTKLPQPLQKIINDPEKRKKLVVYINPPYAEAPNYGKSKDGVSLSKIYNKYKDKISFAVNELSSQFLIRICQDLPNTKLALFSTLKYVSSQNFEKFRQFFKARFEKGFICPANTFDNVKGSFPIGFIIWDLKTANEISKIKCDAFNNNGIKNSVKIFLPVKKEETINNWLRSYYDENENKKILGYLRFVGPNFQVNNGVFLTNQPKESDIKESRIRIITLNNLIETCIYVAVRHCIAATWLNDRDQFLFPKSIWKKDNEFQNDCLTFSLFHSQNKITSSKETNHWIPFTESEVNSREKFESNFMANYIKGKLKPNGNGNLLKKEKVRTTELEFSPLAKAVFQAGLELWRYYHAQPNCNVNASLYDIREHFQGRNEKGKMKNKSNNETYNMLITNLRDKLKLLAQKIEPKVYEYEFLKI